MKRTLFVLLATLLISPATFAQKRGRSTAPKPKPAAAATSDVRTAGANRVADQIKTLAKFVYILGGVTSGIASVDEAARRNEASPAVLQMNQQSKATVKSSIAHFRESLDKLEIDFRGTPDLQPYYIKLAGVAAGAATAEEQASANQFDASGRTLLTVIGRLTDVLVVMRM